MNPLICDFVEVREKQQSMMLFETITQSILNRYVKVLHASTHANCVHACVTFCIAYCVQTIECSTAKFSHVVVSDGKCIALELGPRAIDGPPLACDHVHHCSPLV